ncbi:MAG: phosphoglycerate kinase [Chitinophagales bacterium]|nr:phosphoglycerate kinase [Chitinophagales bacterium]MDW8419676.1 phosphoglycerate kinase [Chitinophagales bacterium]
MLPTIDTVNFNGKRALIRVDFNVPLDKKTYAVTDDTRLRGALPTIRKVLNDGGSAVLMSHLGRPLKKLKEDGSIDYEKHTLRHVLPALAGLLGCEVKFAEDCIGEQAFALSSSLKSGEVLLLENLRFHKGEEKGDEAFAQKLSKHGDIYVNDAFGTAHRAHASTTIVARYFEEGKKLFGYLMEAEIRNARRVLESAERPFTAILGGAKVSDKILIIENLLNIADHILIGGGMAYTFFKAEGGKIGSSLCEDDKLDIARDLLDRAKKKGVHIHLPVDSVIADAFANEARTDTAPSRNIPDGWMGLDIGPEASVAFSEIIRKSKTILWNGPMGVFEMPNFQSGTRHIAQSVAAATEQGAFSLVGGGDSVAAVNQFGFADKVSYVSTGGGAMLEYFEGKVLPGIQAITG